MSDKKDLIKDVEKVSSSIHLKVSSSPFVRSKNSIQKIMLCVVIALIPACICSVYFFGLRAISVLMVSVISSMFFQFIMDKIYKREKTTVWDFSSIVTGILIALNVPVSIPYWILILASFIAIVVAKELFGGLGHNIFNPAIVARVFLLISFPAIMSNFVPSVVDGLTGPTPLTILKVEGISALSNFNIYGAFMGQILGSIGETSALAILIGAIFLLITRCISLTIPLSFIGSFLIIGVINFYCNNGFDGFSFLSTTGSSLIDYLGFHLFTGGLLLGAFFMATDMVTSPTNRKGQLVFGIGCGVLTAVIRFYGSYPEGVSFAILVMNAFTPLIDKWSIRYSK